MLLNRQNLCYQGAIDVMSLKYNVRWPEQDFKSRGTSPNKQIL
jgi:hypothetical protein